MSVLSVIEINSRATHTHTHTDISPMHVYTLFWKLIDLEKACDSTQSDKIVRNICWEILNLNVTIFLAECCGI